jgi:hypothetical protein
MGDVVSEFFNYIRDKIWLRRKPYDISELLKSIVLHHHCEFCIIIEEEF